MNSFDNMPKGYEHVDQWRDERRPAPLFAKKAKEDKKQAKRIEWDWDNGEY